MKEVARTLPVVDISRKAASGRHVDVGVEGRPSQSGHVGKSRSAVESRNAVEVSHVDKSRNAVDDLKVSNQQIDIKPSRNTSQAIDFVSSVDSPIDCKSSFFELLNAPKKNGILEI